MSIKAQELRIGNFLEVGGNIWTVSDIFSNPDELYFKENENYNHLLNAVGIPITEEWLLRFGFSNENLLDEYYLEPYYFNIIDMTLDIGGIYVDLKYIHQLQNLIHALTGKELELKK